MDELILPPAKPNWAAFYRRLCHVGPIALTGVDRDLVPALQLFARSGEGFWSDQYEELLIEYWSRPAEAVDKVMAVFAEEVRGEFMEYPLCWFGPMQMVKTSRTWSEQRRAAQVIGHRLTPRLRHSLVRAAASPFVPTRRDLNQLSGCASSLNESAIRRSGLQRLPTCASLFGKLRSTNVRQPN